MSLKKWKQHSLKCIKSHLEHHGRYLLDSLSKKWKSEYLEGQGDALLRVADLLKGRINGGITHISKVKCLCKPKRTPCYNHYETGKISEAFK